MGIIKQKIAVTKTNTKPLVIDPAVWEEGWDDVADRSYTIKESCYYCGQPPPAKSDWHPFGQVFGGFHQECYRDFDKKSRQQATGTVTDRPGMRDGSCEGFVRAEKRLGRITAADLCNCGQPWSMHGDDPIAPELVITQKRVYPGTEDGKCEAFQRKEKKRGRVCAVVLSMSIPRG